MAGLTDEPRAIASLVLALELEMKTALSVALVALILAGVSFATRGTSETEAPAQLDACCIEGRETVLDEYEPLGSTLATPVALEISGGDETTLAGACADSLAAACDEAAKLACAGKDAAACASAKNAGCEADAPAECELAEAIEELDASSTDA